MYLFSDGPKEYDFLLKVLSLGRDNHWRKTILEQVRPKQGSRALDIACGTGSVSFDLAAKGSSVVGIDVTREMLLRAMQLKRKWEQDFGRNESLDVEFIQARAESLPLRGEAFDCATISLAMRNVTSVSATLGEMSRCTKRGGKVVSMDFTRPKGSVFSHFYSFYTFRALPALGSVVSRHWNGIFLYLANSIRKSKSPEQICQIMAESGVENIGARRMTMGVTAIVGGTKR